jgi:hypothetical protein
MKSPSVNKAVEIEDIEAMRAWRWAKATTSIHG